MELILNDLSISDQFFSIEAFEEYFLKYLNRVFHFLAEEQIPLYKKSDTYSRIIAQNISVGEYLRESANRPIATLIKKTIIDMAYCEPYWDMDDMQSRADVKYRYPNKYEEPNCYTEAIERKCPLLSIKAEQTQETRLVCYRNDEQIDITDIRNDKKLLEVYLLEDVNNVKTVIENYPLKKKVICAEISGRCYAEEAILENYLNAQDILKFIINLNNFIQDKSKGEKTHWWDSIKDDICEYRLSISNGREFRMFCRWDKEVTLLNGFVKKDEKTPQKQIEMAEKIKKAIN